MKAFGRFVFLGTFSLFLFGCTGPPIPQEVKQAEILEHDLWGIGGPLYAPQEYQRYKSALRKAKDDLIRENSKFFFFRDYGYVQAELKELLEEGERLRIGIQKQKNSRASDVERQIATGQAEIEKLRRLASMINEGYLARKNLTKAELSLTEAELLCKRGEFDSAQERLNGLNGYLRDARDTLAPMLTRYTDHTQIAKWRRWVEETVSESRHRRNIAIVVSKIDRRLILYRNGNLVKTYPIAIGRNGSSLKLHAGDHATPEGEYRIVRKLPRSKYYKALLINYPNAEDKRRFISAKVRGRIPRSVGIGGLVEIHGGGKDGMTYGCIALDNDHMGEIFAMVDVGTRVSIVGSTDYENNISSALNGL